MAARAIANPDSSGGFVFLYMSALTTDSIRGRTWAPYKAVLMTTQSFSRHNFGWVERDDGPFLSSDRQPPTQGIRPYNVVQLADAVAPHSSILVCFARRMSRFLVIDSFRLGGASLLSMIVWPAGREDDAGAFG